MIIAGAVILYVTVILFGVDESIASDSTVNDLCHGRVWLCVIGFSLLYGTMFAKTWKIYHILKHSKLDPDMVKVCMKTKHSRCLYMFLNFYLIGD